MRDGSGARSTLGTGMRRYILQIPLPVSIAAGLTRLKDKMIPVTAGRVPRVDYDQLMQYPSGYRHLAYLQERTMNVEVMKDMPGHLRENGWRGGCRACGENHDLLYRQCKAWVEGKQIDM